MAECRKLDTASLDLVPQTRAGVFAWIEEIEPAVRAELSATWLALLEQSGPMDPWIHGFVMKLRDADVVVGSCCFKGPPDSEGMVEIAYGVEPEFRGRGYATEAAAALARYAFDHPDVRVVRAHTLPEPNASTRVLTRCGFQNLGEVIEPDDGLVWRWEIRQEPGQPTPRRPETGN